MTDVNYKKLYDEEGTGALVLHALDREGEAYALLKQKIQDESDLIYIHSKKTGYPYIDKTLDGYALLTFDSKADAEMKLQDLTLQGYSVELKGFMALRKYDMDPNVQRTGIFPMLFKHGFEILRVNEQIAIPLLDIADMPVVSPVVSPDDELINGETWSSYLWAVQSEEIGIQEDIDDNFQEFYNVLFNQHYVLPIKMKDLVPGTEATLNDFTAPHIVINESTDGRPAIAVCPDLNSLVLWRNNKQYELIREAYSDKMQFFTPFAELVEMAYLNEVEICMFFSMEFYLHLSFEQVKIIRDIMIEQES